MNEGRKNLFKGAKCEAIAVLRLIEMGYNVSTPTFKECKYDLVIETSNDLYRAQVKKLRDSGNKIDSMISKLSSGHYDSSGKMQIKGYSENEVDGFLLVDMDRENLFWFHFDETGSSVTVAYEKSKYNSVNYYKDYFVSKRLEPVEDVDNIKSKEEKSDKSDKNKIEGNILDH